MGELEYIRKNDQWQVYSKTIDIHVRYPYNGPLRINQIIVKNVYLFVCLFVYFFARKFRNVGFDL